MSERMNVLVIDDERNVRELVRDSLERSGFEVLEASAAEEGLEIAAAAKPDLIVLDIRMPGIDGLEALRRLRSEKHSAGIPVIMLTAESAETDRIVGLEMGADDYMAKPFSPRELAARVKSVLRRSHRPEPQATEMRHRDLVVDAERHVVTYAGEPLSLTATEFRIVQFLIQRAGKVVTRSVIHEAAHGENANPLDRTVDAHIKAIRKKLGVGAEEIQTVRGYGYKLR